MIALANIPIESIVPIPEVARASQSAPNFDLITLFFFLLMAYFCWTAKQFLAEIKKSSRILIVIAVEHLKNHPDSALKEVDLSEVWGG